MIKQNQTWGVSENVTVAEFGNGGILVMQGHDADGKTGYVMLSNGGSGEVGKERPEFIGKTSDELSQDVIMVFSNAASVDVLIEALQRAKEQLPTVKP